MTERRDVLLASREYLLKAPLKFTEDETFPLIYCDVKNYARRTMTELFRDGKTSAVFGGRGVGKTMAMQGTLLLGTQKYEKGYMPIPIIVKNGEAVNSIGQLEDAFYRSVLLSLVELSDAAEARRRR